MAISLEQIVTGMSGGPEAIMQNFNNVKNELERMNGSVTSIPANQFTSLNATNVDTSHCSGYVFKFNNFALMQINAYVSLTMKSWTYRDVVSVPKSYFNGYSKFTLLGNTDRIDDENVHFSNDFHIDKGAISIYTHASEWSNKGTTLVVYGILHN